MWVAILCLVVSCVAAAFGQLTPGLSNGPGGGTDVQGGAGQQVAPPIGRSVISGMVVDGKTHAPVRKAEVGVNGPLHLSAVTDAGGSFTFRGLPAGSYFLNANREQYFNGDGSTSSGIVLTGEDSKSGLELKLYPGARITGQVVDQDGAPVPNCQVMAMRFQNQQGRRQLVNSNGTNSDDQGEYHLGGLMQGRYVLRTQCYRTFPAAHPFMRPNDPMIPHEGYAPVFYGAPESSSGSGGMPLKAGAELSGVDFHVNRTPLFTVHGTLEGAHRNVQVQLNPRDLVGEAGATHAMFNPARGDFTASVPAGSYEVTAVLFESNMVLRARQDVEVGKTPVTDIQLRLLAGATITGSVESDDPNASLENQSISLSPLSEGFTGPYPAGRVGKDGTFEIPSVLPGRWRLNPVGMGYLKSVSLGGHEVSASDFEIGAGGAGPLRIMLGSKMGKLEVNSPGPTGQMMSALLLPRDSGDADLMLPNLIAVSSSGQIAFPNAPPGKFRVLVLPTDNGWTFMNQAAVLKALGSHAVDVEITEGGDQKVSVPPVSVEDLQRAQEDLQ